MMNPRNEFIRLEQGHCHNCLRCVRACPTNAMTYLHNRPTIVEDECILCGQCYKVCPHDAKAVISDLDRIKGWLNNHEQVIITDALLAASFKNGQSYAAEHTFKVSGGKFNLSEYTNGLEGTATLQFIEDMCVITIDTNLDESEAKIILTLVEAK